MYKFISIGSNCACLGYLGSDRIKGPVDNMISTKGSVCVEALFSGNIVDEIVNNPPLEITNRNKGYPTDSDKAYIYKSYTVCHNNPVTEKFKEEFLKRYKNFKDFYNHINEPNHYFTYSFEREVDKVSHLVNDIEMINILEYLKELNLLDKTLFVSTRNERVKNNWNYYATNINSYIEKYDLKHIEIVDTNIFHPEATVEQFQSKIKKVLH